MEMIEIVDRLLPLLEAGGEAAFWLLMLVVLKGYVLGGAAIVAGVLIAHIILKNIGACLLIDQLAGDIGASRSAYHRNTAQHIKNVFRQLEQQNTELLRKLNEERGKR